MSKQLFAFLTHSSVVGPGGLELELKVKMGLRNNTELLLTTDEFYKTMRAMSYIYIKL